MKRKTIITLLAALCLCSCGDGEERNTPLGWCVNEVMSNYDAEYPFSYSEVTCPKNWDSHIGYDFVDRYEIRVFIDDPDIWATDYYFCGVAYNKSTRTYKRSEVEVDCDFIYRIYFEELP